MSMRFLIVCLALVQLGCGSSRKPPEEPHSPVVFESRTPESLLPVGADLYLRVNDLRALEHAFTPAMLRQLGRVDAGVVIAEYGSHKVILASDRRSSMRRPRAAPLRETKGGGEVFERGPDRVLVVYPRYGAYVGTTPEMVERVDAVVRGEAPSLEAEDVMASDRLARDKAAYGFARRSLEPKGPVSTVFFALEHEERARVVAQVEVPGVQASTIGPLLKWLPPDTVAFEAHALPAPMPAPLERLYQRTMPDARNLLERASGMKLTAELDPRRLLVAVVVPPQQRAAPLLDLMRHGLVVGMLDGIDSDARTAFVESCRAQAIARWGAEAVRDEAGSLVVDAGDHHFWVHPLSDGIWMAAGASEVAAPILQGLDAPPNGHSPVVDIDDMSAALWIDKTWAAVPEKLAGRLLVRPRPGAQLTTLRIEGDDAVMSIDLGMLETLVTLAIRASLDNIAQSIKTHPMP